jgi:nitrite reductase (NADH) small subunit
MSTRTVVVGHGMVGHRFVESLRRRDTEGRHRVVLLAEESRPAYDRVALSSYLGDSSEADPTPAPVAVSAGSPTAAEWTDVCPLERVQPERAVGALVAGEPVAVVRAHDDRLFALHNVDPFSGASVLARGIVGDVDGRPVIASPLYKQHFALEDGRCLEDADVAVATYPVRVVDGVIQVGHT